jgi:hypothetical protein
MKTRITVMALGLTALLMGAGLVAAQEPVKGADDPEALFTKRRGAPPAGQR